MKKYIVIAIAVACLIGSQAKAATFTLNFAVQTLRDQNGNPVADTTLVLAVADTTGSGLAGLSNLDASTSTAQGGSIGSGSSYFVLSLAPNSTQGAVANGTVVQELALPLATGQDVYLLWFPTLTTSSTTVGFNTPYGVLGGAAISAESVNETGDPWVVPAGGALVNLYATDVDGGGLLTASQLTADQISQVQVPEPSTIVLVGMGLLGALGLARRRSQNN